MWFIEGLVAVATCATTGLFAGLTIWVLARMGLIPIIAICDEKDLEKIEGEEVDEDIQN